MRVHVDPELCEANGVCVGLAPEVFALDDEERLHITLPAEPSEPQAELAQRVHAAVRSCPRAALAVTGPDR